PEPTPAVLRTGAETCARASVLKRDAATSIVSIAWVCRAGRNRSSSSNVNLSPLARIWVIQRSTAPCRLLHSAQAHAVSSRTPMAKSAIRFARRPRLGRAIRAWTLYQARPNATLKFPGVGVVWSHVSLRDTGQRQVVAARPLRRRRIADPPQERSNRWRDDPAQVPRGRYRARAHPSAGERIGLRPLRGVGGEWRGLLHRRVLL